MKIKYILIASLTFIILINNSSALEMTEKEICTKVYYFDIAHLTNNSLVYTTTDLNNLAESINFSSSSLATNYIENYYSKCYNLTGLELPLSYTLKNITKTNNPIDCNYTLNYSILGYNFDNSIPTGTIYEDFFSCSSVNNLKFFFNLFPTSNGYKISGIKFYWFILIASLLLIYELIKFKKTNKLINEAIKRLK